MQWNISSVNFEGDFTTITGFSPVNRNSCIEVIITKSTLEEALKIEGQRFNGMYHEGYALTIIHPGEVYIIDIKMYHHDNDYTDMQNKPFVHIDNAINFFDNNLYMGLNRLVYMNLMGLMRTII